MTPGKPDASVKNIPPVKPANGQITVDLPPGMTAEQYQKLFTTFVKNTERAEKVGEAEKAALNRLILAHKDEYLGFRKEEWGKQGLDASKLHINRK